MQNYLKTIYSEKRAPASIYPAQLAKYLINRFDLSESMKILELGCGRSDFLREFHFLGLICSGIDRDESALDYCENLDIKIADLNSEFPFPDNYFDVVYHKSVIEHFYSPEHIMKETLRILKPDGKVIILTPDWVSQMKVFYEDITHCRPFDIAALRDALTIYGFKNIVVEKFYQYPPIWNSTLLKLFSVFTSFFIDIRFARWITNKTNIKYFRWSNELMVLGYGEK